MICKHCKKDIPDKATKCPECQSDLRNWVMRHKILTGIGIFILLTIILASVGSETSTSNNVQVSSDNTATVQNTPTERQEPEVTTTVKVVVNEFENNSLGAQANYAGKLVQVSGKVGSVDEDILGNPYVVIYDVTDQYNIHGVQCLVGRNNTDSLLSLSKDQKISVQGIIDGDFVFNVLMNDCSIVN